MKQAPWNGVRNFQARNLMRDQMQVGDRILFYHSSVVPSGVAGLARVCRAAHPDSTAWDSKSDYFDHRSTKEKPLWVMVDVEYEETFSRLVSLDEMKRDSHLTGLMVIRKGMRLSIQPVSKDHFEWVCHLGRAKESVRRGD
jgi:predicted RNA-binding protein with PUA-like domain